MKHFRASEHRAERRVGRGRGELRVLGLALAGALASCSSATSVTVSALPDDGGGFLVSPSTTGFAVRPTFGPTTVASHPPPPISGGTLLVTRDGAHAVASDPERDNLYVVDLKTHAVVVIALTAGDEPGRLVEDGAARVHVALRSGGALVTLDPVKGSIVGRRAVCAAPRGLAWDATTDLVWVACATGELVGLPAAGGAASQSLTLERDLRDVVVNAGSVAVTKFRSAEVLRVSADGTVTRRDPLPSPDSSFAAHVAWRTVAGPGGTLVAVHQAESTNSVETQMQGGYGGGGCGPGGPVGFGGGTSGGGPVPNNGLPVTSPPSPIPVFDASPVVAVEDASLSTSLDAGSAADAAVDAGAPDFVAVDTGAPVPAPLPPPPPPPGLVGGGNLPGPSSSQGCIANANGAASSQLFSAVPVSTPPMGCLPSGIVVSVLTALAPDGSVILNTEFPGVLPVDVAISPDGSNVAAVSPGNAFTSGLGSLFLFNACGLTLDSRPILEKDGTSIQPIAVAFNGPQLLVQTRQPSELRIYTANLPEVSIALSPASREDTGHDVFHTQAGGMIACASCHPEGRDDGHVWTLNNSNRRTPSLQGTIAGTAPYHWPGDEADLNTLVNDVYTIRMNGGQLPPDQMGALTGWVQTVPAPPASTSSKSSAATRGQALFERADVGCASCHSGPKFTNNKTMDVGTGGSFQVPPLVGVAWRTPLMHDGCATTIADRFGKCSTSAHGSTGTLSASDISDLIAYLETL